MKVIVNRSSGLPVEDPTHRVDEEIDLPDELARTYLEAGYARPLAAAPDSAKNKKSADDPSVTKAD